MNMCISTSTYRLLSCKLLKLQQSNNNKNNFLFFFKPTTFYLFFKPGDNKKTKHIVCRLSYFGIIQKWARSLSLFHCLHICSMAVCAFSSNSSPIHINCFRFLDPVFVKAVSCTVSPQWVGSLLCSGRPPGPSIAKANGCSTANKRDLLFL